MTSTIMAGTPTGTTTWDAAPADRLAQQLGAAAQGLPDLDPDTVLAPVLAGVWPGATEADLRLRAIETAAALVVREPSYSRLAARLLAAHIADEAATQGVRDFADSVRAGHEAGLLADDLAAFVAVNSAELAELVDPAADDRFEYFGLRTVYDRYLLRHPVTRRVLETPQHFLLRVACGLMGEVGSASTAGLRLPGSVAEVARLYAILSRLAYLPSSPTLFNAGARRPQLSSCFLLDSPRDELESIYERYGQIARLSKYAGGIGVAWSRIRSRGSLIRGTNGLSNGIVPWLRTLDASVAAVNQGGRRKGAACVYLETWHADLDDFLQLRDSTGDESRRTHNLHLANWVPDEFMRRVEADASWSLFDPKDVPQLVDLWGDGFDAAYRAAEAAGLAVRTLPARELYGRMMRTLAQTGNGWMTFKDAANRTCNQTAVPGNTVHLSNLCTEILEVTSDDETAVCNLGSINLAAHCGPDGVDWAALRDTVTVAVRVLDRTIDLSYYPTGEAAGANSRWRPIGLGVMGLADVFFTLGLDFDSPQALALSTRIAEQIALAAYDTSADLAVRLGAHPTYADTRAARGVLHPDHWADAAHTDPRAWAALREKVARTGLRNSLLIAIAPTATIASIAGCAECIEPPVANVFKRETLSGEFLQVNRYLVEELKARGLWTGPLRERILAAEGSIAGIEEIPAELRTRFRTAWELPQRALIDLAAARAPYIDQSQSLNLFMAAPEIGKLSSMYAYAWRRGLKTTYYLRSRPATSIAKTTTGVRKGPFLSESVVEGSLPNAAAGGAATSGGAPVASAQPLLAAKGLIEFNLENPEICEACQ
ncbi:ribonucleoside-diphosphate reductase subunit alpha [Catellatospora sp. KI3]|uniref:ribonucleoside-diphosphate reductase subunit alpha n=1 Tax=Catellatospora sp. KI3 TaxID=3041620 RepID=UPI002482A529|nr:ribonucleoside-diphosphate reductase subunit alpha [Catellatospora sp. KI3]MDI1464389.1 ribonucleoside-diphosphate reductase subunit alpha [Catellatospora sp. KI3]